MGRGAIPTSVPLVRRQHWPSVRQAMASRWVGLVFPRWFYWWWALFNRLRCPEHARQVCYAARRMTTNSWWAFISCFLFVLLVWCDSEMGRPLFAINLHQHLEMRDGHLMMPKELWCGDECSKGVTWLLWIVLKHYRLHCTRIETNFSKVC